MVRKLGWLGTFGLIVLCLCVLGGVGLYLKWFTISASNDGNEPNVHLSVNKPKIDSDIKAMEKSVANGEEKVVEKVHSLLGEKTIAGTIHQMESSKQELTILDNKKQEVTIKVDAATRITIAGKSSSFSDLTADDSISVNYEAKKDGNFARTITVLKKS
jgi:hypothetical protein